MNFTILFSLDNIMIHEIENGWKVSILFRFPLIQFKADDTDDLREHVKSKKYYKWFIGCLFKNKYIDDSNQLKIILDHHGTLYRSIWSSIDFVVSYHNRQWFLKVEIPITRLLSLSHLLVVELSTFQNTS